MPTFSVFRLPHADDYVFGCLTLLFLSVPLAFSMQAYEKFEIVKLGLWALFLGAGMAAWAIQWKRRAYVKGYPFLLWALLFFVAFGTVSAVFSVDLRNSWWGFYPRFTSGLLFYLLWAGTLLLTGANYTADRARFWLRVILFDGFIIALVGIIQALGVGYYEGANQQVISRAPGLLGNPDFTGMFLAGVIPVAVVFLFFAERSKSKWYYGITAFLGMVCIGMLSSRGAILAEVFGLIALAVILMRFSKKMSAAAGLSALLAFGIAVGIASVSRPHILSANPTSATNIDQRLFVWDVAREGIAKHPWLGVGPGNFHILFQQLRGKELAGINGVFDDPHNMYLHMAATGGVPQALVFLLIFFLAVWRGTADFWKNGNFSSAGVTAGLVALLLAASFTPVSIACFLALGLFSVLACGSKAREIKLRAPGLFRLVVFSAGCLLAVYSLAFMAGEHLFFYGYNSYFEQRYETSLKALRVASVLDPQNDMIPLYIAAGKIHVQNNRTEFFSEIERFVARHPDDARSHVAAANLLFTAYRISGNILYDRMAVQRMNASLAMDPLFAQRYGLTAYFYFLAGEKSRSLAYAKFALSLRPDDMPSWLLLANIYQADDRKPQVLYALEKARRLRPSLGYLDSLYTAASKAADIKSVPIPTGFLLSSLE